MKNKILIIAVITVFSNIFTSCGNSAKNESVDGVVYTCTMHPEVEMDKPGQCPKCGMDLVKKEHHHEHSDSTEHSH